MTFCYVFFINIVCLSNYLHEYGIILSLYSPYQEFYSYWEKCDEKYLGRTNRRTEGKQYTPLLYVFQTIYMSTV
jgi:hypothetical protein